MKAKSVNTGRKSKSGSSKIAAVVSPRNHNVIHGRVQIKSRLGDIFQEELMTIDSFVEYTPSPTPVPGKGIRITR